jgi:hypothetical protein
MNLSAESDLNVMSSEKLGGSRLGLKTATNSYITAGHYFLILKGRHLERSKKPVSAIKEKKRGRLF